MAAMSRPQSKPYIDLQIVHTHIYICICVHIHIYIQKTTRTYVCNFYFCIVWIISIVSISFSSLFPFCVAFFVKALQMLDSEPVSQAAARLRELLDESEENDLLQRQDLEPRRREIVRKKKIERREKKIEARV